jgi:hypothetical protein
VANDDNQRWILLDMPEEDGGKQTDYECGISTADEETK